LLATNHSTEEIIVNQKNNLSKTQKISSHELGENSDNLAQLM